MNYEKYIEDTIAFMGEVSDALGGYDEEQTERIVTAVLHTVREILPPEESMHLVSQLPMLLKAIYVNGWQINEHHRIRTREEFLECLMSQSPETTNDDLGDEDTAMEITKTVLHILKQYISAGEVVHIINQFPSELVELWFHEDQPV